MLALALLALPAPSPGPDLDAQDVVWTSPSVDAAGSMPIGNGEVVLNVWVEAATGDVCFYIARTDALSEICRFLKLGEIRVHLEPSPFKGARDFRQRLDLRNGEIDLDGGGTSLKVFVDADAHVIHVAGSTGRPVRATATIVDWRTRARALPKDEQGSAWTVHDAPFPLVESADRFIAGPNGPTWYHRNETSVVPKLWANQSLEGLPGRFDPLLHRTFGGKVFGPGFVGVDDRTVATARRTRRLDLQVATYCAQTDELAGWLAGLDRAAGSSPTKRAEARTRRWWNAYWNRSHVFIGGPDGAELTRGYVLQRYVQGCQGRGAYPIKFNGGFFTVEPKASGKPFDPDWRAWGDGEWWQNIRHMYHPMAAEGDLEMTDPLFRLYEKAAPLAEARTKLYHQAEGVYFPETMSVFGTYSGGDYGWDRAGAKPEDVHCPWWQYAWNQGPELVALMLDRWDYARDPKFLRGQTLPMAVQVLRYFDTRFKKDAAGKIVLDPTQAVETYWTGVVDDMPTVAGLRAITERLCALPAPLVPAADRAFFARLRAACPPLPRREAGGVEMLSAAERYNPERSNVENPELYAVWPFQLVSTLRPKLLAEAKAAYAARQSRLDVGWGYDGNVAAVLGMADEAARIYKVKCENSNKAYRWPATWGPNFDWLPDQNHGGNLLETAQLMLLQGEPLEAGGKLAVLPAWPSAWPVKFKLHAPGNTVVEVEAAAGVVTELKVTPAARAKDVVLGEGWRLARN